MQQISAGLRASIFLLSSFSFRAVREELKVQKQLSACIHGRIDLGSHNA